MSLSQRFCPSFEVTDNAYTQCVLDTPRPVYPPDGLEFCKGISPDGSILGPSTYVEWTTVPDADFYVVQFALSNNFQGPTLVGEVVPASGSGNTQTLQINAYTHYHPEEQTYWRVFAVNNTGTACGNQSGASLQGQSRSFTFTCQNGNPDAPEGPGDDTDFCEFFGVELQLLSVDIDFVYDEDAPPGERVTILSDPTTSPKDLPCGALCKQIGGTWQSIDWEDAVGDTVFYQSYSIGWKANCVDGAGNPVLRVIGPALTFGGVSFWRLLDGDTVINNGSPGAQPVDFADGTTDIETTLPLDAMGNIQPPTPGGVGNCIRVAVGAACESAAGTDSCSSNALGPKQIDQLTLEYGVRLEGLLPNGLAVQFDCILSTDLDVDGCDESESCEGDAVVYVEPNVDIPGTGDRAAVATGRGKMYKVSTGGIVPITDSEGEHLETDFCVVNNCTNLKVPEGELTRLSWSNCGWFLDVETNDGGQLGPFGVRIDPGLVRGDLVVGEINEDHGQFAGETILCRLKWMFPTMETLEPGSCPGDPRYEAVAYWNKHACLFELYNVACFPCSAPVVQ